FGDCQDADVGVDGPRRGDDLAVVLGAGLAGVGDLAAVAHQEAPVERDVLLAAGGDADAGGVQRAPGVADRRGDGLGDFLGVGGVLVTAEAAGDGAAGVCVVGADEDVLERDLGVLGDGPAGGLDRGTGDEEGVDPDQGDGAGPVVDDAGNGEEFV